MSSETNASTPPFVWMLLLLVVLGVAVVRSTLLAIPLDRDEGDYAHGAQLILEGAVPYRQFYQMKLPGTYLAYAAAIGAFGPTLTGVHLGLLVANAATVCLVFLLGRRLFDPTVGLLAAASFGALSLGHAVQGLSANTEHFVVLFAVAGLWLVFEASARDRRGWLFGAGLLLGTAFLMKQHGIVFAAVGGAAVVLDALTRRPVRWREPAARALVLAAGVALPYALVVTWFWAVGALGDFWFWTVEYPRSYLAQEPVSGALGTFARNAQPILRSAWPLWALAGVGLAGLGASPRLRPRRAFLLVFCALSLAAVVPGYLFRPHYFVLVLPVASLLAAGGAVLLVDYVADELATSRRTAGACALIGVAIAASLYLQRDYLFHTTPFSASRFVFGRNPFPESIEIAERIREDTTPSDAIAVLGSEPQIYFYADRAAATGQIYMYPLMESHPQAAALQERVIREIEAAEPKYVVWVEPRAVPWSWRRQPDSPNLLFDWFSAYRAAHYDRVGLVEFSRTGSHARWGTDARGAPRSDHWVEVLRRRAE